MTYSTTAPGILEAGYSPLPLPQGKKWPPPSGFTGANAPMATTADVLGWCADPRYADGNTAVRLPRSVIALDVDDDHKGTEGLGSHTWDATAAKCGTPPQTWIVSARGAESRSGHRLYRLPAGTDEKALTGLPGIDVLRFGHRYSIAPGSVNGDAGGKPYACWHEGTGEVLDTFPNVADLPELPAAWVEAFTGGSKPAASTGWQRYNPDTHDNLLHPATVEALGILIEKHGVRRDRVTFRARGDEPYLEITRPGKSAGNSATLGYVGPGVLKVFTTGWDDFPEGVYDLAADEEVWDNPEPLEARPDPIPLDGLPEPIRRLIEEVSQQTEAPIEVAFSAVFGTLSAATRGVFEAAVHAGWNAGPSVLWPVTLADSGERKDGAMDLIVGPLHDAEKALAPVVTRAAYRARSEVARHRKAAKDHEKNGQWDLAADETRLADEAEPRADLQLILDDTTTEALGVHMEGQRGATAIFSTEAQAFRTVAGAYSDAGANVSLLNKAYDGKGYRDKRVKRAGVNIPRPILTWCAAVQPQVLAGYANNDTEGSGFIARFLLLAPRSLVGFRTGNVHSVDPVVMNGWIERVRALHAKAWPIYESMTPQAGLVGTPTVLPFDEAGRDLILSMFRDLEERKRPGGDLAGMGGWIEKHLARIVRIAMLLALWENPNATSIGLAHVESAASLSEPLIEHGRYALNIMRGSKGRSEERSLHERLPEVARENDGTVTTRNVFRAVQGQAWVDGDVERVRAALLRLADLGWVRPVAARPGPGRPSEKWALHPSLTGAKGSGSFVTIGGIGAKGSLKPPSLTNSKSTSLDGECQNRQNPAPPLAAAKPSTPPFRRRSVGYDEDEMLALGGES